MNFKQYLVEASQYKPADVMSKLAAIDNNHEATAQDSTLFGLKDSSGNVVEVRVASDQAEDFENALGRALNDLDDPQQPEIAEVLFGMHDKFTILDVNWPQVIEDEEEDATDSDDIDGGEESTDPMGDGDGEAMDDGMTDDQPAPGGPSSDDITGVLDAVIQMMTADAEAKRQESVARAADARAREAEIAAKISNDKLSAEEEVADMEAHYQTQSDEQKEAKKLAKLAKYRHDLKSSQDTIDADDMANDMPSAGPDNALDAQSDDAATGMDTANRDNVDSRADATGVPTSDGVENEERVVSNPQFKQLADLVKYLHTAKVHNARND